MQFANPLAFWMLTAAAPLIAMYVLKVRRKRVRVASLMLWQAVIENQRRARPWDRFRRHDLLWLQLLALLLVTLALAAPSIPGTKRLGKSVVWIVDGSASMAATKPAPNRFHAAQQVVVGGIDSLSSTDEGMVVLAGPDPRVVVSFTRDKERLRSAVKGMDPTGAEASVGSAVDLAVALTRNRPERTVVVVTDGSDRTMDAALARHPGIRVEHVGRPADNVAITALDLRRSPTVDLESELFVTLRRFGGDAAPVGIEVTLDGELVATEAVDVPPDRPVARVYRGLGETGGLIKVHIETGDALRTDDDAVAWLDPPSRRRVVCVGCSVLTGRALASDPRFDVTAANAWNPPVEDEDPPDLYLFEDGSVPEEPGAPFLALGPSAIGAEAAPEEVEWPQVTQWRRSHPTLRFVDPGGIHVMKARPPTDRKWEPLLESDQGALLSTGIQGGMRGVVLHFRPSESDMPLRVAYPLFLLNAAGWLTGEEARGTTRTLSAGAPLLREGWGADGDEVALVRPDGTELKVPVRDSVARFGGLDQVGVYKLRGPAGRSERVAVNLVSETESDLAVMEHMAPVDEGGEILQASAPGRLPLVRPLLALMALLLVGEWLLYQRKYRDE
ncbi:MAG: VWA domain-containing protein [Proteobacteria bacterium]|nr:VWA domain-containing protein [Pseudomonadota bacterium]